MNNRAVVKILILSNAFNHQTNIVNVCIIEWVYLRNTQKNLHNTQTFSDELTIL